MKYRMKSFKRFLTVLEKSRAVFLLLGKGVKMEMQFTEHFQDVLQEYKKVFMEVTGIDESLIDDESLILGVLAHDMERMKKTQRFSLPQ